MSEFFKSVLAIDSALGGCTAAILTAGGKNFSRTLETQRDQAAKLVPMIQALMEEAGVTFADLGLIVTTTGPGSFTGLRIGLSTARAMGLSLGVPVQGVGTFEVVARSCDPGGACLVVLETKREDFYVQAFDCDFKLLQDSTCLKSEEIFDMIAGQNFVLCGDASARLRDDLGSARFDAAFADVRERGLPDPVVLGQAGLACFVANGGKAVKAEPVYLRGADVSISKKTQRQIDHMPES